MLRVGTAPPPPPPPDSEAEVRIVGTHHRPLTPQARHRKTACEQPTSRSEPYEESTPTPTTIRSARNSVAEGVTSRSYRQHQRQQSAPSLPARRPNAPSLTPHNNSKPAQAMALTGDRRGGNSPGRFGGRRSGASTPSPAEHDATTATATATTASSLPQQQQHARSPLATAVDTTPKSGTQSRFGFLSSWMTTPAPASPAGARTDDELCDLDIEAALFPASSSLSPLSPLDNGASNSSNNSDAFSPAAYKNLQANATGLLRRMQDAYRARTAECRALRAEREAQGEEMEEMELRARHFRTQLETMAAKAAEQEAAMQRLVAELRDERRARQEEREKMMMMMRGGMVNFREGNEEDLGVDEDRKRWRASNSTVKTELSIDTETDADSAASAESESIFSRSRSPTAMTVNTENESFLDVPVPIHVPMSPSPSHTSSGGGSLQPRTAAATLRPKSAQQLTAFQRLVKGISARNDGYEGGVEGGCRNCKGQDASVAWDTVSLLRDENSALKQRVAHLDVVVEGALDIVNGIGI